MRLCKDAGRNDISLLSACLQIDLAFIALLFMKPAMKDTWLRLWHNPNVENTSCISCATIDFTGRTNSPKMRMFVLVSLSAGSCSSYFQPTFNCRWTHCQDVLFLCFAIVRTVKWQLEALWSACCLSVGVLCEKWTDVVINEIHSEVERGTSCAHLKFSNSLLGINLKLPAWS